MTVWLISCLFLVSIIVGIPWAGSDQVAMRICAFARCGNSSYTLNRWLAQLCKLHKCRRDGEECSCEVPFKLFPFPTERRDPHARKIWTRAIYRQGEDGKNWTPASYSRICSVHFVDGKPTPQNPYPTLNLGHPTPTIVRARKPPTPRTQVTCTVTKQSGKAELETALTVQDSQGDLNSDFRFERQEGTETQDSSDHQHYCFRCNCSEPKDCTCDGCLAKGKQIKQLTHELHELEELRDVQSGRKSCPPVLVPRPAVIKKFLANDHKATTYTGLPSVQAFNDLLKHLSPKTSKMRYWSGVKRSTGTGHRTKAAYKRTPMKPGPKRRTTQKEELLLVLMKLRLGVINELLADMFGISCTQVSQIFNTWIKMLAKELRPLLYWPSKESIREALPKSLAAYPKLRCTIDCTEVFIERPRDLKLQALTWSDYKKHNTFNL